MKEWIQLSNGTLTAEISPEGAQLMSLCAADGVEYLWQRDPAYWSGCAPVLFPIVGALRDDKTRINGNWYTMKQHGLARHRVFQADKQSKSRVVFTLKADEQSKQEYPFEFVLRVEYSLVENVLSTVFTVENAGDVSMPYAIGGHPAFNVPLLPGERFEDYEVRFEKKETADCPRIAEGGLIDVFHVLKHFEHMDILPLRHELFAEDALVFENLSSRKVRLLSRVSGRGVEMDFSQFPMLGIWSARNRGPFVALEPWAGCATRTDEGDEFTEKHAMRTLNPGESESLGFSVKIR